jgi:hypothetical protein
LFKANHCDRELDELKAITCLTRGPAHARKPALLETPGADPKKVEVGSAASRLVAKSNSPKR